MNLGDTLVLLKRVSEACDQKVITCDDLFLLLSINQRTEAPHDIELNKQLGWYFKSLMFYDVNGKNEILIPWATRVEYLIDLGLLCAPYGEYIKINKQGRKEIQILKLEVTEKFRKGILTGKSSKEKLWEYLLSDVWGEELYVEGKEFSNRLPAKEYHKLGFRTEEDVMNLFWKLCDAGNTIGVSSFFNNTIEYKEEFGTDRILIRYLLEYKSLQKRLEAKKKN
jgi:hypothetical protein